MKIKSQRVAPEMEPLRSTVTLFLASGPGGVRAPEARGGGGGGAAGGRETGCADPRLGSWNWTCWNHGEHCETTLDGDCQQGLKWCMCGTQQFCWDCGADNTRIFPKKRLICTHGSNSVIYLP